MSTDANSLKQRKEMDPHMDTSTDVGWTTDGPEWVPDGTQADPGWGRALDGEPGWLPYGHWMENRPWGDNRIDPDRPLPDCHRMV